METPGLGKSRAEFMPAEHIAGKLATRRYSSGEKAGAVRMVRSRVKQAAVDAGVRPPGSRPRRRSGSGTSNRRTASCAAYTRSRGARRVSSGRSSTASSAGSGVHRRQQGRGRGRPPARSRTHQHDAAGGCEHLVRRQGPAALGAGPARRGAGSAAGGAVGGQPRGLRLAEAVESRSARRDRDRPRPDPSADVPAGIQGELRSKRVRTTRRTAAPAGARVLVGRQFQADKPSSCG